MSTPPVNDSAAAAAAPVGEEADVPNGPDHAADNGPKNASEGTPDDGPDTTQDKAQDEPTESAASSAPGPIEAAAKKAAKAAAREATAAAKRIAKEAAAAAKKAAKEAAQEAQAERKARRRADKERKERVIHTRVPESLDQELKDRASALGVSVSNLVRNVLNHTFGLVEDVITDSASVARSAKGDIRPVGVPHPEPTPPAEFSPPVAVTVFGYQRCVLSMNALCESCNAIIAKGSEGAVAVLNVPTERPRALCLACLTKEISA